MFNPTSWWGVWAESWSGDVSAPNFGGKEACRLQLEALHLPFAPGKGCRITLSPAQEQPVPHERAQLLPSCRIPHPDQLGINLPPGCDAQRSLACPKPPCCEQGRSPCHEHPKQVQESRVRGGWLCMKLQCLS